MRPRKEGHPRSGRIWVGRSAERAGRDESYFFRQDSKHRDGPRLWRRTLMATAKIADIIVDTLASIGVTRIYGVPGDSLNGITDSIRTNKKVAWIHMRNEEAAAFAAGADAHLTGDLAVCAGSCGPGN